MDVPGNQGKLPTARQLRESGLVIVREQFGEKTEICVYQDGHALYQVGNHFTVFLLHPCRDYLYMADGKTVVLPEQFFGNREWYLRLVLEGEDRLNRNHEEKERNWNVSYSAVSEDWPAMENLGESMLEQLAIRETVTEILERLPAKQKYIIQKYYLQEKTQEQISKELGISQQAVSAMISQAIRRIRKNYSVSQNLPDHKIYYGEGRA